MQIYSGGCLCGAVRYQARGPLRDVVFCHCSQCRRQTGLYYAATAVSQSDLVLDNEDHLRWYSASDYARRGFCGTCGSALFWHRNGAGHVSILVGSLDDPGHLKAIQHICTEGRPAFYDICDGLPQFPGAAPGIPIAES